MSQFERIQAMITPTFAHYKYPLVLTGYDDFCRLYRRAVEMDVIGQGELAESALLWSEHLTSLYHVAVLLKEELVHRLDILKADIPPRSKTHPLLRELEVLTTETKALTVFLKACKGQIRFCVMVHFKAKSNVSRASKYN